MDTRGPRQPRWVQHRLGSWLPNDQNVLEKWLEKMISYVEDLSRIHVPFHPVIEEFKDFIERDPVIYMGFHQMFEQVPKKPPYDQDPTGKPQVRDYMCMLRLFNHIIITAPKYEENDLIGFPINAILDWPMGTSAGLAMFCDPRVNEMFKKMFYAWSGFLTSSDSCYVLTAEDDGWFGPKASAAIPNFTETFVCDSSKPYYGFASWDRFFTREFRPGKRPVLLPGDDDYVNNACESTIYRIRTNIQANEDFWMKGEPYNLRLMLNNDPAADLFVGGTIYQAFLSALSYHRWHSPVNGKIVRTVMVPGTYYAESPTMGFQSKVIDTSGTTVDAKESGTKIGDDGKPVPDPAGPNNSQAFITSTAARALIYIQADNRYIGLMCFMAVGMAEVSTNQITVQPGQVVKKGDQLGMFHFGGSTHCLIFRPETKITFFNDLPTDRNIDINSPIAKVSPS
jgi:phosphatidylserine decarboxylase